MLLFKGANFRNCRRHIKNMTYKKDNNSKKKNLIINFIKSFIKKPYNVNFKYLNNFFLARQF